MRRPGVACRAVPSWVPRTRSAAGSELLSKTSHQPPDHAANGAQAAGQFMAGITLAALPPDVPRHSARVPIAAVQFEEQLFNVRERSKWKPGCDGLRQSQVSELG